MTFRDRNPKPGRGRRAAALAAVDSGSWYELIYQGGDKAVEVRNTATADGAKGVRFTGWAAPTSSGNCSP